MFFAYVGPGAGFAFFSTILLLVLSGIIAVFALLLLPFKWIRKALNFLVPVKSARWGLYVLLVVLAVGGSGWWISSLLSEKNHPRMIVLGMDGLDPDIVRNMMDRGELPNFQRLAERGGLYDLRVPNPPISPTSWASFITGTNPGRHGIFGFIGRNTDSYRPELFTKVRAAKDFLGIPPELNVPGPYKIPLIPSERINKRQGEAFWDITSEAGVESTMVRVPVTFPPETVSGKMLSGLGTPDLRGTQGTYSYWTERTGSNTSKRSGSVDNNVNFYRGTYTSTIEGPTNPLTDERGPTEIDVTFHKRDTGVAIVPVGTDTFVLKSGQWSSWKKLIFPLGLGQSVSGVVRFHLNSTDPFQLYMTPIQINPMDPVMAISHPEGYSRKLAKRIGYFYTMGMAQDDQALKDETISDQTFLEQSHQGLRERRRIMGLELRRQTNGLMVAVFDSTDRIQHLMWRHRDEEHPLYDPAKASKHADAIPNVYRKMDEILGEVLDATSDDVPIMVVSDHGFASFRRQFNVNTWLKKNGYLSLKGGQEATGGRFFRNRRGRFDVDWSNTKAYQVGLTGIYLNMEGRESRGTVAPEDKWAV
ncbi:MAG: alkaline phosphatase family protein, partial [bacterium]